MCCSAASSGSNPGRRFTPCCTFSPLVLPKVTGTSSSDLMLPVCLEAIGRVIFVRYLLALPAPHGLRINSAANCAAVFGFPVPVFRLLAPSPRTYRRVGMKRERKNVRRQQLGDFFHRKSNYGVWLSSDTKSLIISAPEPLKYLMFTNHNLVCGVFWFILSCSRFKLGWEVCWKALRCRPALAPLRVYFPSRKERSQHANTCPLTQQSCREDCA